MSFLSGLGLGLLVAFAVYLWAGHLPYPPWRSEANKRATDAASAAVETDVDSGARPKLELPSPKFDFYKILPEIEVPVPEWEFSERAGGEAADRALGSGTYLLQVGSFKRYEDADRVKAELALQGITASIQRVVINGEDVWFRVHLGPLSSEREIRAMRQKLMESEMDFILLKIGDSR